MNIHVHITPPRQRLTRIPSDPFPPPHHNRLAQRIAALCPELPPAAAAPEAPPTPQQQTFAGDVDVSPLAQPLQGALDDSLLVSPPHQPLPPPAAAAAVPRDPRQRPRNPRPAAAVRVRVPGRPLKVEFMEPVADGHHEEHTTYVKSHPSVEAVGPPGTRQFDRCLHCKEDAWRRRCWKCGRCDRCARLIFCKGAERRDPSETVTAHGHIQLLADRMDRAIWAAFKGHDDFLPIYALIAAGVNPNYKRTHRHETALMAAAYRADAGAVEELLRLGADPALTTKEDNMTALAFALRNQNQPCINLLQAALQRQQQPQPAAS